MKTKIVKVDEVEINSLIKKNFSEEFMRKIYDIYSDDCMSIVEKTILYDKLFTEEFGGRKDYRRIGEGTNRFVCLLDNHIVKVAYNYLAYIDNMNELAQAKYKQKYLAQAYETNGIILISEYVTVMDKEEFLDNQTVIKGILDRIPYDVGKYEKEKMKYYILGDMGMSNKNYGNWGRRMNGDVVILDYGYMYELTKSEWKDVAKCPVCGTTLSYTNDYSELKCDRNDCHTTVKYTTLRNNFGYANIIDNIKELINKDKYVKFDEKGKIKVDVMERVEVEEEKVEEFKMPEDIQLKIDNSKEKYFEIVEFIQHHERIDVEDIISMKEEIFNNKEDYDEMLLPYVISALELTYKNVDKYLKDFEKVVEARYKFIYNDLKKDFEDKVEIENKVEDDDDEPDCYDVNDDLNRRGYESEIKAVDLFGDETRKLTSLDEILGSTIDDTFKNLYMVEDDSKLDEIDSENSMTLDHIMNLLNTTEELNKMYEENEKEEELDDETEKIIAEEELEDAYNKLEDALTELIEGRYKSMGILEDSEEDYVTGDVYRTYLNGDFIDLDYSPRVNARNILGGWRPDEFALPLYRHMLVKYDYDMDMVDSEYEATYRIDEEVEVPEDIYSKLENRSIVIGQILNRFEDDIKPPRHVTITAIGQELNKYYEALDNYYDKVNETKTEVGVDDPSYYLKLVEHNDSIARQLREAKNDLRDELLDENIRLEDKMNKYNIGYYYDIESIMTNTELNILDIIKSNKFVNRKGEIYSNIKDLIVNKYYMEYGSVLSDDVFDVFKYNGSTEKEIGCEGHSRVMRPRIKAKLVKKDSNEDLFVPDIFNRLRYKRIVIEQRFEILINSNQPDEVTKMNDIKANLNRKGLYYTESNIYKYSVRKSKDNLRFGLTEKEIEILEEYERLLGIADINDRDRLFKKSIVEVLNRKYDLSKETKEFMDDLYKLDLAEAYANRLFKIYVLEISGSMSRIDYLKQVEA